MSSFGSRRFLGLCGSTLVLAAASSGSVIGHAAEPDTLSYSIDAKATFVFVGNALGLAGQMNANGPGLEDSNHTFTSVDQGVFDDFPPNPGNPWPAGTTYDWTQNSSAALLDLPAGSTVIWAQLFWGGGYRYFEDVSAFVDDGVQFTTPMGTFPVSPVPEFSKTLDLSAGGGAYQVAYYLRSAIVTSLVTSGGSGVYALGSVPATQHEAVNALNAAGWTLVVVVAHESWACRSIVLNVSGAWIEDVTSSSLLLTGLAVPGGGAVEGCLITGAIDGDADRTGDGVGVREPGAPSFVPLSGPNNPETNFFASQINAVNGLLDTSGTWGSANHDAVGAVNVSGGRQGWDQTGVPLNSASGTLTNGQTAIEIRHHTTGDAYVVTFIGLEVDADPGSCSSEIPIFADNFESGTTSAWSIVFP